MMQPATMDPFETRLGDDLVSSGKLAVRDWERALAAQDELGGSIGAALTGLGLISEEDFCDATARVLGLPLAPEDALLGAPAEVPGLLPGFAERQKIFPMFVEDSVLHAVLASPWDPYARKALQLATGLRVQAYVAPASDVDRALERARSDAQPDLGGDIDSADAGDFVEHLRDLASEAPVIKLVSQILGRVVDLRASDIHLEPVEEGLKVRYRIDGVIQSADLVALKHAAAVTSRVKLLAHLDIAERRLPQDGRIKTRIKGHEIDLRVSTVPTVYGESVVLRVLDRSGANLDLARMGFLPRTLDGFMELLGRPHGILLVTGPTGSGKTTTLYGALGKLDAATQKIITVEDPVEYQLGGINQIQVHPQIGLTFAHTLRSILRQDPDIIMIGEMRDGETAQIAVQSSLTGHLVLSTLHTNSAAGAVVRMVDMGVERYLITSTVIGVLAQRLVRTLCTACKRPSLLGPEAIRRAGLPADAVVYEPVGCPACRQSGYVGRTAIHELMVVDESIRRAILGGDDAMALQDKAVAAGMQSLYADGLDKVALGLTSLEELLRVTQDAGDA